MIFSFERAVYNSNFEGDALKGASRESLQSLILTAMLYPTLGQYIQRACH